MPGTINALVVTDYKSDAWSALGDDTRKARRPIIERFRAKHGNKRVALLRREHVLKMLAESRKPTTRLHWLKAIRGLLRFAVPSILKVDPTEGIAKIKLPKSKGHHTWTDDAIAQYRAHWPARNAAAFGDGVRLGERVRARRGGPPRTAARVHRVKGRARASASSGPMAAKTSISRSRRSLRQRATPGRSGI